MILGREGKESIYAFGTIGDAAVTRIYYSETRKKFKNLSAEQIQAFLDGSRSSYFNRISYVLGIERLFDPQRMALRHLIEDKRSKDLGLKDLATRVESYNSESKNNPVD
mgnify:CR=1 FL=1